MYMYVYINKTIRQTLKTIQFSTPESNTSNRIQFQGHLTSHLTPILIPDTPLKANPES
jgi:hypothetical protein